MSQAPFRIGMIGCGTVGGGVARLLAEQHQLYQHRLGRPIELTRVLVSTVARAIEAGHVTAAQVTDDADAFFAEDFDAVIEVAGGAGAVGDYVRRALTLGRHVVTANKSLLASHGRELFKLAREHGVSIAFEASCGGGIPCVTAIQTGLTANEYHGLYGILNGTCNYILTEMTRKGRTYEQALAEAKELGYAEADETLDVSGRDAAQKLAILASLAFNSDLHEDDVPCIGIDGLELMDIELGAQLGYAIKLLATAERWPGSEWIALSCRPCFIHNDDLLADVEGSFNALLLDGHAVGQTMLYGRGAGAMPTASAVVSDLISVLSGGYPALFANLRLTPDRQGEPRLVEPADTESRYYLRINARDVPGVMAKVTRALGDRNISLASMLQPEANAGQIVPVVFTTHTARQGDLLAAAEDIARLDQITGKPVLIRIIDLPRG